MFDADDGDFDPSLETPTSAPPMTSPPGQGQMLRQPQIERPVAPPQPMPPSMAMALARPGPMPPRGIFSNGDPALGTVEEISPGHMLGFSLLLPAVGTVLGAKYGGGAYGAFGGGILGGSLLNGYRAAKNVTQGTRDGDKEALISGTYFLLGLVGAGYLFYKGLSRDDATFLKNKKSGGDDDDEEDEDEDEYVANLRGVRGVR